MGGLLLITHQYPFNTGDAAFIQREIPYLAKEFQTITVLCLKEDKDREIVPVQAGVRIVYRFPRFNKLKGLLECLLSRTFLTEIASLFQARKVSLKRIKAAAYFFSIAQDIKRIIRDILVLNEVSTIYTYWSTAETLSALLLKRENNKIKLVTRAHGHDLYKERTEALYQPFKHQIDKEIDQVFCISEQGVQYYIRNYSTKGAPVRSRLSRLGVSNNTPLADYYPADKLMRIVSCSYISPIKRIDLIIQAFALIDSFAVEWTHLGGGPHAVEIQKLAKQLLDGKVKYNFVENLSSTQIMEHYSEKTYDCFISASESEGLPVSMMEAMSFGLPVIGTDVGGVSEIVTPDTGILLSAQCTPETIAKAIIEFSNFPLETKVSMHRRAYTMWKEKYDAEKNFSSFSKSLKDIDSD